MTENKTKYNTEKKGQLKTIEVYVDILCDFTQKKIN